MQNSNSVNHSNSMKKNNSGNQLNSTKNRSLSIFATIISKIDKALDRATPLLLILLALVILRIPNLVEPYWYGDEAIYLTIGNALSAGSSLYQDIVDHKTPVIYYLAMVPTQFYFRLLLLGWMLITTSAFYFLSLKFFNKKWLASISTIVFMIFTTLPWFEGNIPNGELFVMGFVLIAGLILSFTNFFKQLFLIDKNSQTLAQDSRRDVFLFAVAGIFFGLSILTKVPALFDVAAFMSLFILALSNNKISKIWTQKSQSFLIKLSLLTENCFTNLQTTFIRVLAVAFGVSLTILISVFYFIYQGTIGDYLEFGLLYNFHYVQTWNLQFDQAWLAFAFSLPGKAFVTLTLVASAFLLKPILKTRTQFFITWFALAMFASLLSNRPYPHYFLQVIPPLALIFADLLAHEGKFLIKLRSKIINHTLKADSKFFTSTMLTTNFFGLLSFSLFIGTLIFLRVSLYPTLAYYQRNLDYLTKNIDTQSYRQQFSSRLNENYKASEIISLSSDPKLFIWGTNPELYALTRKQPVGRFTVSFHIKDLNLYQETAQNVLEYQPHFIVVMNNEEAELPGLKEFLQKKYLLHSDFEHFQLWKKISNVNHLN
jgi:hypothetical protein